MSSVDCQILEQCLLIVWYSPPGMDKMCEMYAAYRKDTNILVNIYLDFCVFESAPSIVNVWKRLLSYEIN